ncbi:prepilin peptidase [Cutibacterium avidum]|nr:prepilin peptidase [Cutibacterium avidum]
MAILLAWVAPMVACCVVDVDVHRLPDVVTLPMLAGLTVCLGILAALTSRWGALGRAVGASVIVFAVFLLLGIIGRGTGMGMGDVKLSASIGLVMGYLSWVHVSSPFSRQGTAPRCTGRWRTVSGFPSRSSDVSE